MLLGTGVEAFEGDAAVERVRTSDGRTLECDFVVVGVGVQPRTELAAAGRPRRRQRHPRRRAPARPARPACSPPATSPTPTTRSTASGSASSTGPTRCTRARPRPATCSATTSAYDRLPYFFSDQYDVGMEYSGFARTWDRVVFRGDPASREFIAFWLADDRVVAGMNVNVWDVTDPIQRADPRARARRRPAPRRPRRAARASSRRRARTACMNRLQALHDAGVSIWLDTLSRELLDSGAFADADRRLRGDRRDLEPDDLRQGDHRLRPLRRPAPRRRRRRRRATRRSCSSSSRSTTSAAPPTCCAPPTRRATDATASSPSSARPTSPTTPQATIEQAIELWAPPRPAQRDDQGSGHRGRDPGDRGAHRPRRQRQHHAAVLHRALRAGHRRLPRRSRAARRRQASRSTRSPRSRRSSSRASTPRPTPCCRPTPTCAAGWRSPTPSAPTRRYRDRFADERWLALPRAGARPQRPLWASTGTKDPAYSDVLYVEELIAPDVINTMPEATLRAFADHGDVGAHLQRRSGAATADPSPRAGRRHRPRRHHRAARARRRALLLRLLPRAARLHREQASGDRRFRAHAPALTRLRQEFSWSCLRRRQTRIAAVS